MVQIRNGQKLQYQCLRCVIVRDQLPVAADLYRGEAKSQLSYRLTKYRATFISASVTRANERRFAEHLEIAWQFVR